jgi:hypothetical protein
MWPTVGRRPEAIDALLLAYLRRAWIGTIKLRSERPEGHGRETRTRLLHVQHVASGTPGRCPGLAHCAKLVALTNWRAGHPHESLKPPLCYGRFRPQAESERRQRAGAKPAGALFR